MTNQSLRILQVSTTDIGGGAEKIAWNLFQAYRRRGFHSWLAAGYKHSDHPDVLPIPNDDCRNVWARTWSKVGNILTPLVGTVPGTGQLRSLLRCVGQPGLLLETLAGHEDMAFPGTWRLLDLPPEEPDIIHCHNLHGGYFDLRALPWISRQMPLVLTLHDASLLSGHCAHSFDCERWKTGCGNCPDLTLYPAIHRDATAYNWQRKRDLYGKSQVHVATPSQWLMAKVKQSILAPAILDARVIPNGVDLSLFHPTDSHAARTVLGLPQDALVLLFAANSIRRNIWKDYQTMRNAVGLIAQRIHEPELLFLALGEDAPAKRVGQAVIRFIPYQRDPSVVARYYQAADVYVHAARIDTFPNTVLEALACGKPVVATAVGGIPEQVEDGITGFLTPPGDAKAMAARIEDLLRNEGLREKMGRRGAVSARQRFDLERQASEYLKWYEDVVLQYRRQARIGAG